MPNAMTTQQTQNGQRKNGKTMKKTFLILTVTTLTAAFGATAFYFRTEKSQAQETIQTADTMQTEQAKIIEPADTTAKATAKTTTADPYQIAVSEMTEMLNGTKPLSFKRAVFLTENAYYGGKLNWTEFCNDIDQVKIKINQMIVAKNLQSFKTAGNWAIFTYMTDSIPENNFHPYTYDLENFMGDKDYESFMVSSLLKTKKGNCHSLPFLYKILADEVNVEAFIATAPMHVFIKHKDEKQQWWNLELTSGTFSRTSFIMESFNVSDAGMESGLYMKPLSDKESVALCLNDLLVYYDKKTGIYYDDFVYKTFTAGLKVYPNSLLQLSKVDYQKYKLDKAMEKKGLKDYSKIKAYPELVKLEKELKTTKDYIAKIGYSSLTPEQYREKVMQIKNESTQAKN
jgi:hypothetical protein